MIFFINFFTILGLDLNFDYYLYQNDYLGDHLLLNFK